MQIKKQILAISLGLVILGAAGAYSQLQAQTESSNPEASAAITTRDSIENDIAEVERSYRGQLEEYRQAEQRFIVAQQEFFQLDTLSALEKAVQATRTAMISRSQVMSTYMELLRLELIQAEGVNLNHKKVALEQIETLQKALIRYDERVQVAEDRASIDRVADDFFLIAPLYEQVTVFTVSLLRVSKMQTIYDRAVSLTDDIGQLEATQAATLTEAEKARALEQVDANLLLVQNNIDRADLVLNEAITDDEPVNLTRELSSIYASLTQLLRYIEELARS